MNITAEPGGEQHERIVKRLVNRMIKAGAAPSDISISGKQNLGLRKWATKKGIVFSQRQKVDIIGPDVGE